MTRLALALALLAAIPAQARTPTYARVKCVGLYCMIVSGTYTDKDKRLNRRWRGHHL